jgi:hypothetical protein
VAYVYFGGLVVPRPHDQRRDRENRRERSFARVVRLQVMMSADEMKMPDDFRFEHRMPSRAATVRERCAVDLREQERAVGSIGAELAQRVRVDCLDGRPSSVPQQATPFVWTF